MGEHKVYSLIVEAVNAGILKEPFSSNDFRKACPTLGDGAYNAFLFKHRSGNPAGNSELFKRVSTGKFKLIRPIKYDVQT
jgi:hypothetical protein